MKKGLKIFLINLRLKMKIIIQYLNKFKEKNLWTLKYFKKKKKRTQNSVYINHGSLYNVKKLNTLNLDIHKDLNLQGNDEESPNEAR